MTLSMRRFKLTILPLFALLLLTQFLKAQDNAYHSVLRQGTWFKLSVAKENVYKLDYSTLQAMGADMSALDPDQIRIFGNPSGVLPEKNQAVRPDDLS